MNTEKTTVKGKVSIWAIPKRKSELENLKEGEQPFDLTLRTDHCYADSAVNLAKVEVEVLLPEGINIMERAIETLEQEAEEAERYAAEVKQRCKQKIESLMLIEHNPSEVIINE